MTNLETAKARVNTLLNQGNINIDGGQMVLTCSNDPFKDVQHLEALGSAMKDLAALLEGEGVECRVRLPGPDDADVHGNVEWRRSGRWMRGAVSDGQPVDATHWRPTFQRA